MADPAIITCSADVWTLVASNVTTGQVWIKSHESGIVKQTYVMTGNPAPTDDDKAAPFLGPVMIINNPAGAIDVYIKSTRNDCKVRVDL